VHTGGVPVDAFSYRLAVEFYVVSRNVYASIAYTALLQELQSDITSRRPKIESLATTAGLMMRGVAADSDSAGALHDQLQEIKDRWNRVNERAIELRSVATEI